MFFIFYENKIILGNALFYIAFDNQESDDVIILTYWALLTRHTLAIV